MIVAIDGPAGAGKSTVAQATADALGFQLLDTGAIYRAVALVSDENDVDWQDGPALGALAATLSVRFELRNGRNHVLLTTNNAAERDVTELIRTPKISQGASQVSAHAAVRSALLSLQRVIGNAHSSVVEGRDIGTVVFPNAKVKVFLTASPQERARRRRGQLVDTGAREVPSLEEIAAEIAERDTRDSQRAIAPLRPAEDATILDSTSLSQAQVVATILALAD
jgi:cytidylate kinase